MSKIGSKEAVPSVGALTLSTAGFGCPESAPPQATNPNPVLGEAVTVTSVPFVIQPDVFGDEGTDQIRVRLHTRSDVEEPPFRVTSQTGLEGRLDQFEDQPVVRAGESIHRFARRERSCTLRDRRSLRGA